MLQITFKEIEDEKELKLLENFIKQNPEFYHKSFYFPWIEEKCIPRIEIGEYKTIVSFSEGIVIGNIIYRYLNNSTLEIKNLRVKKPNRGRDIGHFMLIQMERDNPKYSIKTDVTENNYAMLNFLTKNGFQIKSKENLYLPNQTELILKKHSKIIHQ